ncbi:MAG: tRNA pseudouridine(13) synthase TruD [Planctomycetota bacterium]
MTTPLPDLAYLTPDLPGTGGTLKSQPEDFLVDELPLYPPSGDGEHLMLFVQKKSLTTAELVRRAAKAFRVSKRDVGYAGLKDKHAITRQHLTVWNPKATPADWGRGVEQLGKDKRIEVLWAEPHRNKIKRGHHAGNQFVITLRDVRATHAVHAKRTLDVLATRGMPNYLGEQRFGFRQNAHTLGQLLLRGDWPGFLHELLVRPDPADAPNLAELRPLVADKQYANALEHWPKTLRSDRQALEALRQGKPEFEAARSVDKAQRKLYISATQSDIFNRVLDARLRHHAIDELLPGDLAWKHDSRAVFPVDANPTHLTPEAHGDSPWVASPNTPDPPNDAHALNAARVPNFELSPSGPLPGTDLLSPTPNSIPAQLEDDALAAAHLTPHDFAGPRDAEGQPLLPGLAVEGSRRPLRVPLTDPDLSAGSDDRGPYIKLRFTLPRGSFATIALREIMKPPPTTTASPTS